MQFGLGVKRGLPGCFLITDPKVDPETLDVTDEHYLPPGWGVLVFKVAFHVSTDPWERTVKKQMYIYSPKVGQRPRIMPVRKYDPIQFLLMKVRTKGRLKLHAGN